MDIVLAWGKEKNEKLIRERGISFEDVMIAYENGQLLDIIDNPNKNYPHQLIMMMQIYDYVYIVPFVDEGDRLFLKTIIPSRKATKKYLFSKNL